VSDAAEQGRSHAEVDHSIGHVEADPMVAHRPAPAQQPGDGALDHPAARQDLEAFWPGSLRTTPRVQSL